MYSIHNVNSRSDNMLGKCYRSLAQELCTNSVVIYSSVCIMPHMMKLEHQNAKQLL